MTMKKTWALLAIVALVSGFLVLLPAAQAVDEPVAKTDVVAEEQVAPDMAATDEDAADMMDEELEDVKILKEAASKLKASDPELAGKLEQLAEDLSW